MAAAGLSDGIALRPDVLQRLAPMVPSVIRWSESARRSGRHGTITPAWHPDASGDGTLRWPLGLGNNATAHPGGQELTSSMSTLKPRITRDALTSYQIDPSTGTIDFPRWLFSHLQRVEVPGYASGSGG
jgi:hypothetical protein